MDIRVDSGDIASYPSKAIIVNLFEGAGKPGGATGAVDRALDGAISQLIADGELKGKHKELTLVHSLGRLPSPRVLVVGLGKQQDFTLDRVRNLAAGAARYLRRVGVDSFATVVHGAGTGGMEAEACAQAIAEGTILGLYTFKRHKKKKEEDEREVQEVTVVERDASRLRALRRAVEKGRILAEAANFARDMANEPANILTPTEMASRAQKMAEETGLECRVLEQKELEKLGMGAFLGVARGSRQPPKLIVLDYRGGGRRPTLGLLGKGITFDSGGISIKPSAGMEAMKGDMHGGASVIAAMGAIARLKPRMNVTAIVPATENMPGGNATKPGDVVRAMSGKTIEVINTDAEGRLILADALAYARKLELSPLVDVATLTGAISIALGKVALGTMTNNQELCDRVIEAGKASGEKIWQLPLFDEYKEQIKSDIADVKNVGGREAGAITAALFLAEFAEDTPWVHLDIAGVDRVEKENGVLVKGASGVPVRTLVNFALSLSQARGRKPKGK